METDHNRANMPEEKRAMLSSAAATHSLTGHNCMPPLSVCLSVKVSCGAGCQHEHVNMHMPCTADRNTTRDISVLSTAQLASEALHTPPSHPPSHHPAADLTLNMDVGLNTPQPMGTIW